MLVVWRLLLLFAVCCLLTVGCCLLFIWCLVYVTVCCWSVVVCCVLFILVARRSLCVAVVCCLKLGLFMCVAEYLSFLACCL